MKLSILFGVLWICLFGYPKLLAQQKPETQRKKDLSEIAKSPVDVKVINDSTSFDQFEIDKLIVNETISKAGNEFTELFFSIWNWPTTHENFIIVITERPFRGISSQVLISVNELVVFESFLQPRYDVLESLAELAMEQTSEYITNYETIMKQLEGEDTRGNGIY